MENYTRQLLSDPYPSSAREYLKSRGFDHDTVTRFRLGYVGEPERGHEEYAGRICLPYLTVAGPVDLKFRVIEDREPKYLCLHGSTPRLFNAQTLLTAADTVFITEGELDAVAIESLAGLPAVGYPGASAWDGNRHFVRCFDGFEHVIVIADGDETGRRAARSVSKSLPGSRIVSMPEDKALKDANGFLVNRGVDEFRELVGV